MEGDRISLDVIRGLGIILIGRQTQRMDTFAEVRVIGRTEVNRVNTHILHDGVHVHLELFIRCRRIRQHDYRLAHLARRTVESAYDERHFAGIGGGLEFHHNRQRTNLHVRVVHGVRTGSQNREDGVLHRIAGIDRSSHPRLIECQEAFVYQVGKDIIRIQIIVRKLYALRSLNTLHLIAADGREVRRKLVVVYRSVGFASEDFLDYFLDIGILIAVAHFRRTFGIQGIAVQQPVVVTGSVQINRGYTVEIERTLHAQTDVVGRVGAQAHYSHIRMLEAIEFQHHLVTYLQTAGHTAQTAHQLFVVTRHVYREGVFRIHLRVMHNILHRTDITFKDLIDIAFTEDRYRRIQCMFGLRYFEGVDQFVHVHEDRVGIPRLVYLGRDIQFTADGIVMDFLIQITVFHRFEVFYAFAVLTVNGIIDGGVVIAFAGDTLVVHTQDDVGRCVIILAFLTCRCSLVSDQRRFGSDNTHIIDDEVVTVPVRGHVIDTHAEVDVLLRLIEDDGEEDLVPPVGRRDIACGITRNIFPFRTIRRALYREDEVRVRLALLATRVAYIAGEEHLLTRAQVRFQREGSYLSGRGHTVAIDHIAVFGSAVLLHRIPVVGIFDAVDEAVLTHIREIRLLVQTVVRQIRRLGIGIAVRSIGPGQRMWIHRIGTTGFVIVKVQHL